MNGVRRKMLRRRARALHRQGWTPEMIARHLQVGLGMVAGLLEEKKRAVS
jgi:Putative ATPase subunit of terminase (gpP-like)